MSSNPRPGVTACAVCGERAEPYGLLRHVLVVEDVGVVCTDCLRTADPDRWAAIEALEDQARSRGWEPDTE